MSKAVFRLLTSGRALASTLPLRCGNADAARPCVWSVARAEAATGQPWVTSLRHTSVILSPVLRVLVPRMDGRHDRAMLAAHLVSEHGAGAIDLTSEPTAPRDAAIEFPLEALAKAHIERALGYLAVNALLQAD